MRKLGRIFRRVLTGVSLVVFVAVLAAWVRGYWISDRFFLAHRVEESQELRSRTCLMTIGRGHIGIHFSFVSEDPPPPRLRGMFPHMGWETVHNRMPSSDVLDDFKEVSARWRDLPMDKWHFEHFGVAAAHIEAVGGVFHGFNQTMIAFPCWMAAIVFGALPLWRGFVWWRAVRGRWLALRAGRCGVCGYDLRASPGRCPECGTGGGDAEAGREGEHRTSKEM